MSLQYASLPTTVILNSCNQISTVVIRQSYICYFALIYHHPIFTARSRMFILLIIDKPLDVACQVKRGGVYITESTEGRAKLICGRS